jgi:hypothetical protein
MARVAGTVAPLIHGCSPPTPARLHVLYIASTSTSSPSSTPPQIPAIARPQAEAMAADTAPNLLRGTRPTPMQVLVILLLARFPAPSLKQILALTSPFLHFPVHRVLDLGEDEAHVRGEPG